VNGRLARLHRQTVHEGASKAVQALTPGLKVVAGNEELTRQRVDKLEARASGSDTVLAGHALRLNKLGSILHRGFWGRLRWLLRGV